MKALMLSFSSFSSTLLFQAVIWYVDHQIKLMQRLFFYIVVTGAMLKQLSSKHSFD